MNYIELSCCHITLKLPRHLKQLQIVIFCQAASWSKCVKLRQFRCRMGQPYRSAPLCPWGKWPQTSSAALLHCGTAAHLSLSLCLLSSAKALGSHHRHHDEKSTHQEGQDRPCTCCHTLNPPFLRNIWKCEPSTTIFTKRENNSIELSKYSKYFEWQRPVKILAMCEHGRNLSHRSQV